MGADGIRFFPISESRSLNPDSYGSTYVTEAYVQRVIEEISGQEANYCRVPKGLWNFQDLYIVSRDGERDLSTLTVSVGPFGGLDECHLQTSEQRYGFYGWAADFTEHAWIKDVQLRVNGQLVHQCIPLYERPDIFAHYGRESGRCSGWRGHVDREILHPEDVLMVKCISNTDLEEVLWMGTFQSLLDSSLFTPAS